VIQSLMHKVAYSYFSARMNTVTASYDKIATTTIVTFYSFLPSFYLSLSKDRSWNPPAATSPSPLP
jgi:hypothetical protein